jgi:cytochrome c553
VCHDGVAARKIAVGGTVFWALQSTSAAPAAQVTLTDHRGAHQLAVTNCAGNFFIFPEQMAVQFPFWISMTDGSSDISMDSPVNGDGSCAKCHGTELSTTSTGRVYLYENPPGPPPKDCL